MIWGHSFGGIVAWEVIRRLREFHQREPIHFVVTGTAAPQRIHLWQKAQAKSCSRGWLRITARNTWFHSRAYVDDPEFFKSIVPLMRRDFPLLTSYRYQPDSPLNCPITAFAARQDDMVYTDEISEWSHHTNGGFELIEVDGDHWFLNRNRERIAATLQDIATKARKRAPDHPGRSVRIPQPLIPGAGGWFRTNSPPSRMECLAGLSPGLAAPPAIDGVDRDGLDARSV